MFQGRKRNPNPNFLVRIFSGGVGVFHVNGWGPKSSIRPSKPGKSNFLGGISRDFAGMSRKCPKSLRKKCLCSILVSLMFAANCSCLLLYAGKREKNKEKQRKAISTIEKELRDSEGKRNKGGNSFPPHLKLSALSLGDALRLESTIR